MDANILFSALIRFSKTLEIILNPKFEIVTPDFILEELIEHKEEISRKSKLSYANILTAIMLLSNKVDFISVDEYKEFLSSAVEISPDEDDVDYFALAMKTDCGIWSDDKHFKMQGKIRVYNTGEIVEYLNS